MKLLPQIKTFSETTLVGIRIKTSLAENKTQELWQRFIPMQKSMRNTIGAALFSVEVYEHDFFDTFHPAREFEKWAAVQVADAIPQSMETLTIPEGLYAVFTYIGKASEASTIYQYIYGTWIPESDYTLDNRPHFAIMGAKYKNEDPASEEELWIPIRKKNHK
ncbi:GyrI-like domain-containing protein [uncultured Pontibacter sp.]|uniref:GyrI-like domain-containing protein n=1 Tax=uncultured Pontibacter sp. TaxID=453356 RepID=UPI002605B4FB|nr:GyrI-like domain-containing protein [uncultured Pontibacter sp.]